MVGPLGRGGHPGQDGRDDAELVGVGVADRGGEPRTRIGLTLRNLVARALTSPVFRPLIARITRVAATDRALPPIETVHV